MATATVRIEGAEELKRQLEALGRAARGPALESAAMAGAEVIRAEAASRAPGPEIEAEISRAAEFAVEIEIGPDADHWYYGFFETGVSQHRITPAGGKALAFVGREGQEIVRVKVDHPGFSAEPFLRPAMDEKADVATEATAAELRRGIERVARG